MQQMEKEGEYKKEMPQSLNADHTMAMDRSWVLPGKNIFILEGNKLSYMTTNNILAVQK